MRPSFARARPDPTPPPRKKSPAPDQAAPSKRKLSNNKGFSGSGDSLDDYGDQSSSYWPEGWSFARWRHVTTDELAALPDGELERTQAGFRDVLGQEGFAKLGNLMFADEMKRKGGATAASSEAQAPVHRAPGWVSLYEKRHGGEEWGFVCFRACCFDDDLAWSEYKEKIDGIARLPFDQNQHVPDVEAARSRFKIDWVEDKELQHASIQELQT